jgi:hypothetical protein
MSKPIALQPTTASTNDEEDPKTVSTFFDNTCKLFLDNITHRNTTPQAKRKPSSLWMKFARRFIFQCQFCNNVDTDMDSMDDGSSLRSIPVDIAVLAVSDAMHPVNTYNNSGWWNIHLFSGSSYDIHQKHDDIEMDFDRGVLFNLQQDYELYRV